MKVLNIIRNKKGVTLIELTIVLAILGIVIVAAHNFFSFGIIAFTEGNIKSEIQQDVNQASYYITNKLRNVKEISLSSQPGYTPFDLHSRHPDLDSIDYTITHPSGSTYNLEFEITRDGHSVNSKIILNNVKAATPGTGSNIWYLATGPVLPAPSIAQLSNITVSDGTLSPAFCSTTTTYTVELPYGTTDVPSVTATGKDGSTYVITNAASIPGSTTINVTSADGTKNATYTVTFTLGAAPPPAGPAPTIVTGGSDTFLSLTFDKNIATVNASRPNTPLINNNSVSFTFNPKINNNTNVTITVTSTDGGSTTFVIQWRGGTWQWP